MKEIVFISGAISSDENYKNKFKEVRKWLEKRGCIVLDPSKLPPGMPYGAYMDITLAMVRVADTLVVLKDWEESPGARAEVAYAKCLGKPCSIEGGDPRETTITTATAGRGVIMKDYKYYKEQVLKGKRYKSKKILKLANKNGWTIAHAQASKGWTTENPEILKLADKYGDTVAHCQAYEGWITENPEILKLADKYGNTVACYQLEKGWRPKINNMTEHKTDERGY